MNGLSPAVLADIRDLLYAGYRHEGIDLSGADGPANYLRTKGHRYLPDLAVKQCDDETRKRLEAEGYKPTNPTARNGYRRTLQATPEEVFDSLVTRQKTTRTRRLRDTNQARNLEPVLTNPYAQAVVAVQTKLAEADAIKEDALAELWRTVYDASKATTD